MLLADFGLCKHATLNSAPHSRVGTLYYSAPEVLTASPAQPYSGKVADIWSCGVILYAMVFLAYPFGTLSSHDNPNAHEVASMHHRIMAGLMPDWRPPRAVSPELEGLLRGLLCVNPSQRLTIDQIAQHPWFVQGLAMGPCGFDFRHANQLLIQQQGPDPNQESCSAACSGVDGGVAGTNSSPSAQHTPAMLSFACAC